MTIELIVFIICTSVNVIISTIKSVMTIKGGKFSAAFWNAASYGLYSFIVVMTANAEISTAAKVTVTVVCNLICVYGVKLFEEKLRKDKLWKWEVTITRDKIDIMCKLLTAQGISYNYIDNIGKWAIFNIFTNTQGESAILEQIIADVGGKSFASETKLI